MRFMDQLNKAIKDGLNICDLVVANEVSCLTSLKGEDFEEVCEYAEQAYLKDDAGYSVSDIVKSAYYLFKTANFDFGPRDILRAVDEGVAWYDSAERR